MKRLLAHISIALAATSAALAANPNVLDIKTTISDDAIIYPESFEADTQKMLESWYIKNYTATDDRYQTMSDPNTSDETIRRRLAAIPTTIEMPFNSIVRSYIDRYTKKSRPQVAAILGLSIYYIPIFEQALEEEQLPLELKYLPVIESALDPNAVSRHGATGLWQFMLATARGVGLEVNTLVDERRDPYASSRKAAKYLHDLYDSYGDWSLAIAAYNCGPATVNKAIRRAGGEPKDHDFWSIYNYLTPETRGYFPMFIAANYVMTYYPEHNISPVLPTKPLVTDTVAVDRRIHFEQISKILSIPVDELRILNPQFRADVIPGSAERTYTLILPSQQALAYVMSEDNIAAFEADKYLPRTEVEPTDVADNVPAVGDDDAPLVADHPAEKEEPAAVAPKPAPQTSDFSAPTRTVTHTVAEGETLADIAALYEVNIADLRSWNALRRNAVRTGQKLRVQTAVPEDRTRRAATAAAPAKETAPKPTATAPAPATSAKQAAASNSSKQQSSSKSKSRTQPAAPKTTTHEIKSGENLTTIAKKYGVSVDELRKANNMTGDNIRAGKTLKVPSKSKSGSKKRKKK